MFIDMTVEEKKAFASKMQSEETTKKIKYGKKMLSSTMVTGILGIIAIIIIMSMNIVSTTVFLPLAGFGALLTIIQGIVKGYKLLNSAIKDASCGQVNYKEYKKLVKSGEIYKWIYTEIK